MKYILQNLKNRVDFFLRQHLKFSRRNYFVENESKEGLFTNSAVIERERMLFEKFDLDYIKLNSTRQNYLENLYTIDLLSRYLEVEFQDELKVLDIGCKNWFYAKGEYFFFKKYCNNLCLKGIEIDANRLYTNFYSRAEVAKFNIKDLENTKFIARDFLQYHDKFNYIVWILPFVYKEPLLKGGLPINYFQPEKMLLNAYDSLKENGKIFIINQGMEEYAVQIALCKKLGIKYIECGKVESCFLKYQDRYALLIKN